MTIIGLIGLIGAGKSTVGKFMSTKGCDVIDLDKISHDLYRKDTDAYNEILSIWGVGILDESLEIDRKKLANIIFPVNDLSKSIAEGSSKLESERDFRKRGRFNQNNRRSINSKGWV